MIRGPFSNYADVAKYLGAGMRLDRLSSADVSAARLAASAFQLPWPPTADGAAAFAAKRADADRMHIICSWAGSASCINLAVGVVDAGVRGRVPTCQSCASEHGLHLLLA